ncbi:beta,beta-carotene 15,15'-dioxygenase-like isoform X1 [Ptychodera flava]|uniref:beta,beta-carotene 15,15'-dioxygenase-like isoform X1 n=1 Tax=Ptychodera flava TaxID=63121 RepID=UPI003969F436
MSQILVRGQRHLPLLAASRHLTTSSRVRSEAAKAEGTFRGLGAYVRSAKETPEPVKTSISGEVPKWIDGSLYRNGPGLFEIGNDKYNHIFDGLSLLHRFNIKDGQVTYQSRFLRSDHYNKNMEANRIVCTEFGTLGHPDPCHSLFQRVSARFKARKSTDNCNVNVMSIKDEMYAMTESPFIWRIDPKTLESVEKVDITEFLAVNMATAHPHYTKDGTHYNMGSSFGKVSKYNIVKIDPADAGKPFLQKSSIMCSIPARGRDPSYYHSFGMTDNYFVYVEQPLHFNVMKIMKATFLGNTFSDCMEYRPENKVRFHVVNSRTGEIHSTEYTADAFMCFHHVNAYEDDGHIVVDLCAFKDNVMDTAFVEKMRRGESTPAMGSQVMRFVLPLTVDKKAGINNLVKLPNTECSARLEEDGSVFCIPERISDAALELPHINYASYNGKPYQYTYGVKGDFSQIYKLDLKNKSYNSWGLEDYLVSEPGFVAAPSAGSEDDGVVLSALISEEPSRKPHLLAILDARDLKEIGRAEINVDMTGSTHGLFIPNI